MRRGDDYLISGGRRRPGVPPARLWLFFSAKVKD